jgi:exonuclease VII small subunit
MDGSESNTTDQNLPPTGNVVNIDKCDEDAPLAATVQNDFDATVKTPDAKTKPWIVYLDLDHTIILHDALRPGLLEFLTKLHSENFEVRIMTNRLKCHLDIPRYNNMILAQGGNKEILLPFPNPTEREEIISLTRQLFDEHFDRHPREIVDGSMPLELALDINDEGRKLCKRCVHILSEGTDWVRKDLKKFTSPLETQSLTIRNSVNEAFLG